MKKHKKELLYMFTFLLSMMIALAVCKISKSIQREIKKEQVILIDSASIIQVKITVPDFDNYDGTNESIKYKTIETNKTLIKALRIERKGLPEAKAVP